MPDKINHRDKFSKYDEIDYHYSFPSPWWLKCWIFSNLKIQLHHRNRKLHLQHVQKVKPYIKKVKKLLYSIWNHFHLTDLRIILKEKLKNYLTSRNPQIDLIKKISSIFLIVVLSLRVLYIHLLFYFIFIVALYFRYGWCEELEWAFKSISGCCGYRWCETDSYSILQVILICTSNVLFLFFWWKCAFLIINDSIWIIFKLMINLKLKVLDSTLLNSTHLQFLLLLFSFIFCSHIYSLLYFVSTFIFFYV